MNQPHEAIFEGCSCLAEVVSKTTDTHKNLPPRLAVLPYALYFSWDAKVTLVATEVVLMTSEDAKPPLPQKKGAANCNVVM